MCSMGFSGGYIREHLSSMPPFIKTCMQHCSNYNQDCIERTASAPALSSCGWPSAELRMPVHSPCA